MNTCQVGQADFRQRTARLQTPKDVNSAIHQTRAAFVTRHRDPQVAGVRYKIFAPLESPFVQMHAMMIIDPLSVRNGTCLAGLLTIP